MGFSIPAGNRIWALPMCVEAAKIASIKRILSDLDLSPHLFVQSARNR
ncbi:MAG TPA: hypothetical protein VFZ23_08010 [Pyrinomonadaceae bacterium]